MTFRAPHKYICVLASSASAHFRAPTRPLLISIFSVAMAHDIPKELRLAPWRQSQGYSAEVSVERHVVHKVVTFERRVHLLSRSASTALPHEKPPQPPPPTIQRPCVPPPPPSSRVPPPPPPPRRLEAGCKKAIAMASPARPKLMPVTARAMLGLAAPLPQPKLPPKPQHQEQPLGGEKKDSGNEDGCPKFDDWKPKDSRQEQALGGEKKDSGNEDGCPKFDDWKPKDSRRTTNVWSKSGNGHHVPVQRQDVKEHEPETEVPRISHRSRSRALPRTTHRRRERRRRQRSRTASSSTMD